MPKFKANGGSHPTGMLMPCPMNSVRSPVIHRQPIAIPVMAGPKKKFARCICGLTVFLPTLWTDGTGLTEKEATARGLFVITSVGPS